jgi:hypothetical protein
MPEEEASFGLFHQRAFKDSPKCVPLFRNPRPIIERPLGQLFDAIQIQKMFEKMKVKRGLQEPGFGPK